MSIFSICLDLWVRYNSQFCWYEWWNEAGPLVPNWNRELRKIWKSRFCLAKVSRCTICFRAPKMLCRELWVGFQLGSKHTCFYSECKFYKMAQNEYDPSATAALSWTCVLFNLTGNDIVRQLFTHLTYIGGEWNIKKQWWEVWVLIQVWVEN